MLCMVAWQFSSFQVELMRGSGLQCRPCTDRRVSNAAVSAGCAWQLGTDVFGVVACCCIVELILPQALPKQAMLSTHARDRLLLVCAPGACA